ncbi:hypothetical protein [Candidatus Cardinium hertigii]|uniref:hypothetical protein n=1 Tax=Candidatus Cardinium hertigii TaxID=247481 RepID=UPI003D7DB104
MIYKKIGNKIPSLSSLLLAGVLLGSNCNKDKNEKAGEDTTKNTEQGAEGEKPKDASGKRLSPEAVEAMKDIYKYLISDVLGIGRLNQQKEVFKVSEIDLVGESALQNLMELCNKFTDKPNAGVYPSNLRDVFIPLKNINLPSSVSLNGGQRKFAHGTALNAIAHVWQTFSTYHKRMISLIDNGASQSDMVTLLTDLDKYYNETIHPSSTVFKIDHPFYDSKEADLLTGSSLVRFLTGKEIADSKLPLDQRYKSKSNTFGMPELLDKPIGRVWIVGKSVQDTERSSPDMAKLATTRGMAISDMWEVEGTARMPKIDAFPNSSAISTTSSSNAAVAPVQKTIKFSQCITTIFNGHQSLDFISFTPAGAVDRINVVGHKEKFKALRLKALDTTDEGSNVFATLLGQHIESHDTKLKDLFFIPDLTKIRDAILHPNFLDPSKVSDTESINDGATNINTFDIASIKRGSAADLFFEHIVHQLGIISSQKSYAELCYEFVNDNQAFLDSDADINKKVTVNVLNKIFNMDEGDRKDLVLSGQAGSLKRFLKSIEGFIMEEVENAIVYTQGDQNYKATKVSKTIQGFIRDMGRSLSEKRKAAFITYGHIEREAPGFDIKKVLSAMNNDYNAIRSILTAQVRSFVAKEAVVLTPENQKGYFPDLTLISTQIDHINTQKAQHLNKNKT